MRSITTRASEARVACIKINEDGDLLFTAGSDGLVSVWKIADGQRLGTYHYLAKSPYKWDLDDLREALKGTPKAVTNIDVNRSSTELAVCRFDLVVIYDVETGRLLDVIEESSKVECCEWNRHPKLQDKLLVGVTALGAVTQIQPCFKVYKCADIHAPNRGDSPREWECIHEFTDIDGRPTVCGWGALDQFVIGGTNTGKLYMWNVETGKIAHMRSAHKDAITSISFNKTRTVCLTVSRDKMVKLWSTLDFSLIREIEVDRPLNACALNPLFDHEDESKRRTTMLLAGGQEARDVTTTSAGEGFFEILIVDAVTGEEENRLLTHYSPTLCLYWHPNGHIFATGAYEGNSKILFCDN